MCPDERLQAPRPAGEEPLDCNEARNSGGGLQRRRRVGLYCFYLFYVFYFYPNLNCAPPNCGTRPWKGLPHDNDEDEDYFNISRVSLQVDHLPFTYVEDPGFTRLIAHAFPKYKIPSRKHFTKKVISEIYKDTQNSEKCCWGSWEFVWHKWDKWTSTCTRFAVVSFTASTLTDDFKKKTITVCRRRIEGTANMENVCSSLDKGLSDFAGLKDKISQVTTDEGLVMQSTYQEMDIPRRSCTLHR